MGVALRNAVPGDEEAIAEVHVRSWQQAYRGAFSDEFLDGLEPERRVPMWQRTLADERLTTILAEVDGEVAGFALIGECGERPGGEVMAIYLVPEVWGRGVGSRLMRAAEEALARSGHEEAFLWVLDRNERARTFYREAGWEETGESKSEPIFGQEARELLYRKRL